MLGSTLLAIAICSAALAAYQSTVYEQLTAELFEDLCMLLGFAKLQVCKELSITAYVIIADTADLAN